MDDPGETHRPILITIREVVVVSNRRLIHLLRLGRMVQTLDPVSLAKMEVKTRATKVRSRFVGGRLFSQCRE
jgi:hypothetical protein